MFETLNFIFYPFRGLRIRAKNLKKNNGGLYKRPNNDDADNDDDDDDDQYYLLSHYIRQRQPICLLSERIEKLDFLKQGK